MSLNLTTNGAATLDQSNTSAVNAAGGDQDEKEDHVRMNVIKLQVPSFIRIFVINRTLFGDIDNDNNNHINCKDLVNQCFTRNTTSSTSR